MLTPRPRVQDLVSCPFFLAQDPAQQVHGQQELSAALQEVRGVMARPGAEADTRPGQGEEPGAGGAAGAAVGQPDAPSQPQQQLSTRSNLAQVRIGPPVFQSANELACSCIADVQDTYSSQENGQQ